MLNCLNHSLLSSKTKYNPTVFEANQMEIRTDSHQNERTNNNNPLYFINIVNVNIRSIGKHFNDQEAFVFSQECQPDVLCRKETLLTDEDDPGCMLNAGYTSFLVKNRKFRGGELMIQCKPSCPIIEGRKTSLDETLFVDIKIKGYNLRLAVICNPPRTNKIDFIDKFDRFLENNNSTDQPMIVCGDMNPDISSKNRIPQNYLNCIEKFCYKTNRSNTCDLKLKNMLEPIYFIKICLMKKWKCLNCKVLLIITQ